MERARGAKRQYRSTKEFDQLIHYGKSKEAENARIEISRMIGIMRRQIDEGGRINACEKTPGWTRMSVAVDSGACDNVIAPGHIPEYEEDVRETKASINQEDFVSATGDPIVNYGELKLPVYTREQSMRGMVFQAAGVAKPLCSVEKLCEAGHVVWFDSEGSFIYNKATGECNALRREEGNFMLDVYVPPRALARNMGFIGPR